MGGLNMVKGVKLKMREQQISKQIGSRIKICGLLRLTDQHYFHLQFEVAETYMTKRCNKDPQMVSLFLQEPMFWNWWKQQWSLVDDDFFASHRQNINKPKTVPYMLQRYRKEHLYIDQYPDKVIWEKIHRSYMYTAESIIQKQQAL